MFAPAVVPSERSTLPEKSLDTLKVPCLRPQAEATTCEPIEVENRWDILSIAHELLSHALAEHESSKTPQAVVRLRAKTSAKNKGNLDELAQLGRRTGGTLGDFFAKTVLAWRGLSELKPLVDLRHHLQVCEARRTDELSVELVIAVDLRRLQTLAAIHDRIEKNLEKRRPK